MGIKMQELTKTIIMLQMIPWELMYADYLILLIIRIRLHPKKCTSLNDDELLSGGFGGALFLKTKKHLSPVNSLMGTLTTPTLGYYKLDVEGA